MKLLAALTCLATGCLSVPPDKQPACASDADCNGDGEVCEEGACWGDPPAGTFAATLSPPAERADELVPLELPQLALPADGWLGDIAFVSGVSYAGRVEAFCTNPTDCATHASLDATITITRPSAFHGGTGFKAVATSSGGLATGSSFSIALPLTGPLDTPYTVTIVPGGRSMPGTSGPGAAELVPPLRMELSATANKADVLELGTGKLTIVDGKLTNKSALPIAGYRIVALGHWDAAAPVGEVSTVGFTGLDGKFAIALSDGLVGTVELVATPIGDAPGPTLHCANVAVDKASTHALTLPEVGVRVPVRVQVMAADGSGNLHPLAGARVLVHANGQATGSTDTWVTSLADVTTGDDGIASVDMYDGALVAQGYRLRVVPPADANVGVVYDQPIAAVDQQVVLASRVALTGLAVDSDGKPLPGVAVTAHPALRFQWSLDPDAQGFLAEIPPATTATDANGEFVVWVDHDVGNVTGSYALVFEPPAASSATSDVSRVARWEVPEVALPTQVSIASSSVNLDPITIPDAAALHGRIADLDGLDVEGAELKLYAIDTSLAVCSQVAYPPPSCPIPAVLQGRGASDPAGIVRLSLPRP